MSLPATAAIVAWCNARQTLSGPGQPLTMGAMPAGREPRSPAQGAYALLSRSAASKAGGMVAEDADPAVSRITAEVHAGTVEAAELAACALSDAWNSLNGVPELCGDTGVKVLVADNVGEPLFVPTPAALGDPFCFQVSADFVLSAQ